MPTLANITVSMANGDGIVWTGASPAAGLDSDAIFRSMTVGSNPTTRPEIRVRCKRSANGTQDIIKQTLVWPVYQLINGVDTVVGYITRVVEDKIFLQMSDGDRAEFVHQGRNLDASILLKSVSLEGLPPQ